MAEYIEREALIAELAKGTIITDDIYGMGIMAGLGRALTVARELPAADVAPVVRCKDCKYYKDYGTNYRLMECSHIDGPNCMEENGYCSYGERKDGDA